MKCPKCAGNNVSSLRRFEAEARKYKCSDCGTVFKPAVPKWNGLIVLPLGGLLLFFGMTGGPPGQPFSAEQTRPVPIAMAIGLGLVTYGILLLRGKAGKLEVQTPPPSASAQPEATPPQKTPPMSPRRLEEATTGDIILSVVLPGWGILIGLMALAKGEKQRAKTMIRTGFLFAVLLAVLILTGVLGR